MPFARIGSSHGSRLVPALKRLGAGFADLLLHRNTVVAFREKMAGSNGVGLPRDSASAVLESTPTEGNAGL
jgi:hypothetical protein